MVHDTEKKETSLSAKNSQKTVQKHFSNEMKRIYPQRFPNASAVT
jgi:hypothetical protein